MAFKSLFGRQLGLTGYGNLAKEAVDETIDITPKCVDCSITVSDEGATVANQRDITIQLQDANGNDIDYVETVKVYVLDGGNLENFAGTGGSTGIAIGTDGDIETLVAKKAFLVRSEADGDIDLTWTDTGTESFAIQVELPNGRKVTTAAYANT